MSAEILVLRYETVDYEEARAAQRRLAEARRSGAIPDLLLLLEHPPVYTRGRRSGAEELPMGVQWYEGQGIQVRETDRGGRVTYHGPGQLVAYPIVDLKPYGDDVLEYVRRLERVTIESLAEHGVAAQTIAGLTGVWTEGEPPGAALATEGGHSFSASGRTAAKIGSIGVHVSRSVTTHGLAVNVDNDLQPFEWIVPCGIEGAKMTSIARERGASQDIDAFAETLSARFGEIYERVPVDTDPAAIELEPPVATLRASS